jgi:hypothetical protein
MSDPSTLSENDAIELLAYVLSSTEGLLREPPHYAPLRMASVADRMAAMWAPRASGDLGAFLRDLQQRMPVESAATQAGGDDASFRNYLARKIGELAVIVRDRNMAGRDDGA